MKALVLLGIAAATGFGTLNDDDWPPERFRAVGTTTVVFAADQAQIDKLCGKASQGLTTEACSFDKLIVLPDPCKYHGEYARIGCHENAHRFGHWPMKHPK